MSRGGLSAARRGAPRGPVVRLRPRSPCGSTLEGREARGPIFRSSLRNKAAVREMQGAWHSERCSLLSLLAALLAGARRRGEVPASGSASRTPRCSTARAGSRCSSSAPATSFRGTGTRAPSDARRGRRVHEPRPRGRPAGAGRLHRRSRLLQRQAVLEERKACRAPSAARLPRVVPAVRRRVPVGAHLLGLERGQPRLAADLPQAQAGGPLLRRAAARRARAQVQGRWPRTCSTRPTSAPTCARSSAGPRATRACGGCTTTRTSTTRRRATRGACSPRCRARSG